MRPDALSLLVNPGVEKISITLVLPDGGKKTFTSGSKADVLEKRDNLDEALSTLSDQVAEGWEVVGEDCQIATLTALEKAGKELAAVLFPKRLNAFVDALQANLAARRVIVICLDPTLWIPWDFVYFDSPSYKGYFGHAITLCPGYFLDDGGDYASEYPVTRVPPRVGLIEDGILSSSLLHSSIDSDTGQEYKALAQIVSDPSDIDVLSALDAESPRVPEIDKLHAFIGAARRVLHLNCHGQEIRRRKYCIRVTDAFIVTMEDLTKRFDLYEALATLNVCNSGVAKYDTQDSLNQLLHQHNAAAVVCTTGRVSDEFATMFASELYRRLISEDLLDAMDGSRKKLVNDAGHPMSLMYTFSGSATFRIPFV